MILSICHLNLNIQALKQQRNVLGTGALAWADKVKPGMNEANVRMSREGLTSTDLLIFCTNVLQDLCTDLRHFI